MLKSKIKRVMFIISGVILIVSVFFCVLYMNDYYRANSEAIAAFSEKIEDIETSFEDDTVAYIPEHPKAGLIFYPGGKVEYTSYEPLMQACAAEDILCVVAEMPLNLAVLDAKAAKGIQEKYPDIESWYIGGHSLGGAMAATYLPQTTEQYDGLILLGSYSTVDLSSTELEVLCVFGTEDMVLDREKYDENTVNLPAGYIELAINGGCHAYFGMYGEQDGDGVATISNDEQIKITADAIIDLILD